MRNIARILPLGFPKIEPHFEKIFLEGPIGMAIVGGDFRLLRVNHRFCEMLGYSAKELLKKGFADITHPDDVQKDVELAKKLFSGTIPYYKIEKRYAKKNGELLWVRLTASLIRAKNGDPLHGLGMVEDISEQKEFEHTLQEKNAALKELLQRLTPASKLSDDALRLTPREIEICNLIKKDFTPRQIIAHLGISPLTLNTHRNKIRQKLGLRNLKVNLKSRLQSL